MWNDYLEDDMPLRSIYGNAIPRLENIFFHEIKIVNGAELSCFIRFDLAVMPQAIPVKWKQKGVNAVQLTIALISAEIIYFKSAGGDIVGDIELEPEEVFKNLSFKVDGKDIFRMRAKWITIHSISGYTKQGFEAPAEQ